MTPLDRAISIALLHGIYPCQVQELPWGKQNHAVRIADEKVDVVVRFAKDAGFVAETFDVEAWCLGAAAKAGIRISELVVRGHAYGTSYIILAYIPGSTASADDPKAWEAVGLAAGAAASIDLLEAPGALFSRFGRDLDAAWNAHLEYNLSMLAPSDPLMHLGVYEESDQISLYEILSSLHGRQLKQGLVHGDLSTRNIIAGEGYTVIDWGAAHAGPAPWGDLAILYRWHVTDDKESPVSSTAWRRVLASAGIDRIYAEAVLAELVTLSTLDIVRWALDQCPERVDAIRENSARMIRTMLDRRS